MSRRQQLIARLNRAAALFGIFLLSLWIQMPAGRADSGSGDSASFTIDNGSFGDSGEIVIENRYAQADFDLDDDVDLADFERFEACATGPAVTRSESCDGADFDLDNDVDQSDFGAFQLCYTGENTAIAPGCLK